MVVTIQRFTPNPQLFGGDITVCLLRHVGWAVGDAQPDLWSKARGSEIPGFRLCIEE